MTFRSDSRSRNTMGPTESIDTSRKSSAEFITRSDVPQLEKHESLETLSRSLTSSTCTSQSSTQHAYPIQRRITTASRASTQFESVYDLERHPTALSRIQTGRSVHLHTVGTSDLRPRREATRLPAFGGGKEYPSLLPDREEYVVEFDGPHDPLHAQNWPLAQKLRISGTLAFVTLTASFGSSIFSAALSQVAEEFKLSSTVVVLTISLYVLGFATGPLMWAPLSELIGRRTPLLIASFGFSIFSIAVAVAKDAQTMFIARFFSGFFGACPLALVGAVFADIYHVRHRGLAITCFCATVLAGPLTGPFVGGFTVMNPNLGWRWTEYITAIMGFLGFVLSFVFVKESYPPIILVNKAAELRRRTLNWGIHAKQEEIEVDFRELVEKNLARPLKMLFKEPIVLLMSIYVAFVYGLMYLFFTLYPAVFIGVHHMSLGVSGLAYLGMVVGEILAAIVMIIDQPRYNRKLVANNNIAIPEWRMPHTIVGGALFAIGLLWFGWTGYRAEIHWIAPVLSGLFTGFGILTVFLQSMNYLIDSYTMFAASAIAANTLLRSIFGAVFPLFAKEMIKTLGIQWTGTLLGGIALLLVPLPLWFWLKGASIRAQSEFAPIHPAEIHDGSSSNDLEKNV